MPKREYPTRVHTFEAGGHRLELLGLADPYALLEDPEIEARFQADGAMPYWAELWPAAMMLAEHILTRWPPAPLEDAPTVLEIGCGLGLAGVAAGVLGYPVVLSDYDPAALEFVRANAQRNRLPRYRIEAIDVRQPPTERFNVILGADILYERPLRASVLSYLSAGLTPGGRALVSHPERNFVREWLSAATPDQLFGLSHTTTPSRVTWQDRTIVGHIWEFTRREPAPREPAGHNAAQQESHR